MTPEQMQALKGMVRIVQYYDNDPETGERRDYRYEMEQFDGWKWRPVPVLHVFEPMAGITKS